MCANTSLRPSVQFFWIYTNVDLLDHMAVLHLIFWGTTTLFSSGCTTFHPHQQHTRALTSSHSGRHLLFFYSSHPMGMRGSPAVVWICISPISDVKHFLMCLLAICTFSFNLGCFLLLLLLSHRLSVIFLILKCISIFGSKLCNCFLQCNLP